MTEHAAFDPLGESPADRSKQFYDACALGLNSNNDFWVAILVLIIDDDVGEESDKLVV